jgi:hypothetical protein
MRREKVPCVRPAATGRQQPQSPQVDVSVLMPMRLPHPASASGAAVEKSACAQPHLLVASMSHGVAVTCCKSLKRDENIFCNICDMKNRQPKS